jgi:phosphatidylserine decarboxylase
MAPYARVEEVLTLVVGGAVVALVAVLGGWWALVPGTVVAFLLSFYRDPPRRVPRGDNLIISPADGKVVEITRNLTGPDGQPALKIMVFLSVFNVHVNRAPCAGRVRAVEYRPGQFLNALRPEADTRNEANTLLLEPAAPLVGPIRIRQIAGVLARRIVCAARSGDSLTAGQRYGMIKLGSRTEILLPEHPDWEILVRVGAKVKGGLTVLARLAAGSGVPAPHGAQTAQSDAHAGRSQ